jgi:hypothetical protein
VNVTRVVSFPLFRCFDSEELTQTAIAIFGKSLQGAYQDHRDPLPLFIGITGLLVAGA